MLCLSVLVLGVAIAVLIWALKPSPLKIPVSKHFNGTVFNAPEPLPGKSFFTVLTWRMTAQRQAWPASVPFTPGDKPVARVNGSDLRATFINHSTFLLQFDGLNILTDPIWSERASPFSFLGPKRVHPPGIAFNDLPQINAVLISHAHYDHLDLPTVKRLVATFDPLFVVPLGIDRIIHSVAPKARVTVLDWDGTAQLSNDVTVTALPTQHWSARTLWDRNNTLWASYAITTSKGPIYVAGDTGYGSGTLFKQIGADHGPFRLALLPIGAYEPRWFMAPSHVNPAEAVQMYKDLRANRAIAMHFGTFQLSDEGIDQPVQDLATARTAAGLKDADFVALKPGQVWK